MEEDGVKDDEELSIEDGLVEDEADIEAKATLEFETARAEEGPTDAAETDETDVEEEGRTAKLTMQPQNALHLRHAEVDEDDLKTLAVPFDFAGRIRRQVQKQHLH